MIIVLFNRNSLLKKMKRSSLITHTHFKNTAFEITVGKYGVVIFFVAKYIYNLQVVIERNAVCCRSSRFQVHQSFSICIQLLIQLLTAIAYATREKNKQ